MTWAMYIHFIASFHSNLFMKNYISSLRVVVGTGATGAIAPVDFAKATKIAPVVVQNSITLLAPMDWNF